MSGENEPTRIIIEREEDWTRARSNVFSHARSIMESRLLSSGVADEALKKEVRGRVEKILADAFESTIPNLRVNGHNYEEYLELTEQFDESLDRTLQALAREQVEWRSIVAERRRKAPDQVKGLEDVLEGIKEGLEWDVDMDEEENAKREEEEAEGRKVDPERLPPRHDETIETYKTTLSNLNEVLTNAPKLVARAERAKAVRETVMALPA